MEAEAFNQETNDFASRVQQLLDATLEDDESTDSSDDDSGVTSSTLDENSSYIRAQKRLLSDHCPNRCFGVLTAEFYCCPSSSGRYFAIQKSSLSVKIGYGESTRPILRIDYIHASTSYTNCHVHVVGFNNLLDYLTPRVGKNKSIPQTTDVLHVPVGGKRFRPGLEDIIELLIRQCGVSHKKNALNVIHQSREEWAAIQTKAVVRDRPEAAIEALESMGYKIEKIAN
nr:MAG TPA: hypothetical protein [Caudoviricetes sp.]